MRIYSYQSTAEAIGQSRAAKLWEVSCTYVDSCICVVIRACHIIESSSIAAGLQKDYDSYKSNGCRLAKGTG